MKGLSLWQPWATLVGVGLKRVETRSWATSYRGPLAIHAAKRRPEIGRIGDSIVVEVIGDDRRGRQSRALWLATSPKPGECLACSANLIGPGTLRGPVQHAPVDHTVTMPLGAVVATCELVACVPTESIEWLSDAWMAGNTGGAPDMRKQGWLNWEFQGRPYCTAIPESERPFGDYTPGRYAWLLANIVPLDQPVPARGRQQLWEWGPGESAPL